MAKILVISPTPTHPQDAGNRARIFALLSELMTGRHKVYFAFVKREGGGDEDAMSKEWDGFFPISYQCPTDRWLKRIYDRWAKRLGKDWVLPYKIDDWYDQEISIHLAEIEKQVDPDVVIVEYVFISKAIECFGPKILKILDTHDIFGDRHRLFMKQGMQPQWFYTTVGEEKKALDRADVVLAIQEKEAAYFRKLTQRKVITVGHLTPLSSEPGDNEREFDRLLFVGSVNPINVQALRWFMAEVFPLVRRRLPNVKLEVVGGCADKMQVAKGLILTGPVAALAPHYRRANAVINPVRFGTGLKIKTMEALANGRSLVSTSAGAAGLEEWAGKAFLVADAPEEFAKAILRLAFSSTLCFSLAAQGRKLVEEYNRNALTPLIGLIDQAGQELNR